MADANQALWWRRSVRLALVVVSFAVAAASAPAMIDALGIGTPVLGLSSAVFAGTLGAPIAIAIAAFWHVGRQRRLDDRLGVGDS